MASAAPLNNVKEEQQRLTGDSFIRPHLRKLSPYQSILPFEVLSTHLGRKPEDIVKLDANENPYGPPPEVNEISLYIYPDPESRGLRAALAEDSGLESEYILCVLEPGDKIVDCPPTFAMYEFDVAVNGALVIKVHNDLGMKILTIYVNLGWVVTGQYVWFIKCIIFFLNKSRMQWVKKHENLIILRTFSKRAALAGLRVGYGAFPLSIIEYLWRAKQPYNVSVAAEVSACAALSNPAYLETVKVALVQERERLFRKLKEVPFLNPYPSCSKFILCEVTSAKDAKKLKEGLSKMGVIIRHYNNKELSCYVRVSVGKQEQTDALMQLRI
ncbi:hypothetical protein ACET3Z_024512 [Daucus carota]